MRWTLAIGSLVACCTLVAACATHSNDERRLDSQRRVVTLVPSFADDVYALGAGSMLVGVSAYTNEPQAKNLPRVADASSVDAEAVLTLRPSVVIGIPAQERLIGPLRRSGVHVVLLADDSYASIFDNLETIGRLTGRQGQARATIAHLRHQTATLQARSKRFVRRPSVFVVLGSSPIWTAGAPSYISTLIELAGGTNAASDLHEAYGQYSAEALVRRQPDVLVADAGLNLDTAFDREPWRSLRAVRLGHVYAVNPDLIERPGPFYNDGIAWLSDRLAALATQP